MLLGPAAGQLGPAAGQLGPKRLVIIPDGALHYLGTDNLSVPFIVNSDPGSSSTEQMDIWLCIEPPVIQAARFKHPSSWIFFRLNAIDDL